MTPAAPGGRPRYRRAYLYLGHNSGAVLYNGPDDFLVFEEEKEIRQKGGEYVPLRTLLRLRRYEVAEIYVINFLGDVDYDRVVHALCGHRPDRIDAFIASHRIHEIRLNHHLTHALNAIVVCLNHVREQSLDARGTFHVVSSDGTGSDYESITVYEVPLGPGTSLDEVLDGIRVVYRTTGFELSCGIVFARLLCNRDTGFAVLKDEYKSLGYETEIGTLLSPGQIRRLDRIIGRVAGSFLDGGPNRLRRALQDDIRQFLNPDDARDEAPWETRIEKTLVPVRLRPASAGDAAGPTLLQLHRNRASVLRDGSPHQHFAHGFSVRTFQRLSTTMAGAPGFLRPSLDRMTRHQARVLCSYLANGFLEAYYARLVDALGMRNVIVAGGVHYNVKLNRTILDRIPGWFSATPMAGDIAHAPVCAALHNREMLPRVRALRWLQRRLDVPAHVLRAPGVFATADPGEFVETVARLVAGGEVVNVVKGRGEYGPRALLNTSTLSLPTAGLRERINRMNARDEYMPMAPAMTEENLPYFFDPAQYGRVIGTLDYMVLALEYHDRFDHAAYQGVVHHDPVTGSRTGRPQVVRRNDAVNWALLERIQALSGYRAVLNTSFNVHGRATVQHALHACRDFDFQTARCREQGLPVPHLVIGAFQE